MQTTKHISDVIKEQRKGIAILSFLLVLINPFAMMVICHCSFPPSISDTWFTPVGGFFVGLMCVISFIFIMGTTYPGEKRFWFILAGIAAGLVALNPCNHTKTYDCANIVYDDNTMRNAIHFASASVFFAVLGYISLFQFTIITNKATPEKVKRNRLYRICGIIIWAVLVLTAADKFGNLNIFNTTFMEMCMILPFAVSFATKSDVFFKDKKE